jgi:hypothetical protein
MHAIFSGLRWLKPLKPLKMALSIGALAAAHHAGAATTSMEVIGVINPGTECTASLSNSELAYGDISLAELDQTRPTVLPTKQLGLNVVCAPFASKFYFRIIERAYNYPYVPENLGEAAGVPSSERIVDGLGLGMTAANRPLGELFLKTTSILADGQSKALLQKYDTGLESEAWIERKSDFIWGRRDSSRHYTVADPVSHIVSAAKNFAIQMDAIPVISPSAIKGLSVEAHLGGKFTIEIHQL